MTINGAHWPPDRVLQAAVCGRGGVEGSQDCDTTGAITFRPADNGVVAAPIVVTVPPVPCPCVVLVTEAVSQAHASAGETLPIDIAGAPSGVQPTVPSLDLPRVTVSDVHVVADSSWTAWFGAAAPRELVLTVHNAGTHPVRPLVIAHWVRGSDDYVISSPPARKLFVGQTAQLTAPFTLSTFAHGQFAVVGKVSGAGFEKTFETSTSATPWGLYALAIILVVGVIALLVFAIMRRRDQGSGYAESEAPNHSDEDPTADLQQIGVSQ